jgi:MFS transporter, Spinster family, sphingosine-1-phosphate transporter
MPTVTPSSPKQKNTQLQPTRSRARFTFTILMIINVLNYTDRSVLSAIQTKIQIDFGLSNTELGLLGSSFLFIYALATLPLGVWADRSIRKNIVAACVGIWSVASLLSGFTHNFIQILTTRSFLGIGEAGYAPASLSMIGDLFPKEQRGRILSLWSIGNLIGTALGLILGGIIADKFGWRWAFYIVGIPGLIAAFFIWRSVEPHRGAFDRTNGVEDDITHIHGTIGKDFWGVVKKILKIRTYWVLLGAFVFSFFTIGSAQTWVTTYLVRAFGLSIAKAGTYSGLTLLIGSLVGTLIGGWLADFLQRRFPQGRMLVATFAFLVGAPITLIALKMHSLGPFLGFFIVAILCLSLALGPINAIIQDVIVPEIRATATGLVLLMAHLLGDASAPLLVGVLADHIKLGNALLITAPTCLFVAGIACLIGLNTVANDMSAMQKEIGQEEEEEKN